jgi:hypothetical protein
MICIVALVVFSFMSIFSAKYRVLAKEAFKCFTSMVTFKPCEVGLETRIKSKATSKLMFSPSLARAFYKNFKIISWAFTLTFFLSLAYSLYAIFNLVVYGTCSPGEPCVLTSLGWCTLEIEKNAAIIIIGLLAAVLVYLFLVKKPRKN